MRFCVLGPEDHSFFSEVAEILGGEGVSTEFKDPEVYHEPEELSDFDGLLLKKSRPEGFRTLRDAEESGAETVNGFVSHMKANNNMASYHHLDSAGISVPEWSHDSLQGLNVVKPRLETMREEPFLEESPELSEDYFCQSFIRNGGTDYKLYSTSVEDGLNVTVLETPSKLLGSGSGRKEVDADAELEDIARKSMNYFEANLLGIDVIESDSGYYVVDVNSAPSYRGTSDQEEVAESITQLLE